MPTEKMNLSMNTKLPDLLDRDGKIPAELSPRGRRLVSFLGEIVSAVSSERELRSSTLIQCRKYLSKRRCKGQIAASCSNQKAENPIQWYCLECGEGGIIYDWRGSIFDQEEIRLNKEYDHICKGVWVNGQRLDEVQMKLQPYTGSQTSAHLLYPAHRIVVRHCRNEVVQLRVPPLLAVELLRRRLLIQDGESVALKLGATEPMQCRLTDVKFPHESGGEVELEFSAVTDVSENLGTKL